MAVVKNNATKTTWYQWTWGAITWIVTKQSCTVPRMFDDIGAVRFVQITFKFIVISLRLCEGVPIDLSGMLKNRVDFNAAQCVSHILWWTSSSCRVRRSHLGDDILLRCRVGCWNKKLSQEVRDHITVHDHVRISLKVMTKVFGSKVQSEKFSGKRGVLALCRRKAFREKCDWTPCVVNALHDGSATAEIWSVRNEHSVCVWTRMGQSGVIAQSQLQIVKCDVGFFAKNQRCETRLLALQELVQGSRNGGKIWNCSPVEIYCTQKRF